MEGTGSSAIWIIQPWLQWIMLYLAYMLYSCNFQIMGAQKNLDECGTIQVDYQTEEQYMIAMFLNIEVVI